MSTTTPSCPTCGACHFTLDANFCVVCQQCGFGCDYTYFVNNPTGPFQYAVGSSMAGHNFRTIIDPQYQFECMFCGLLVDATNGYYNGKNLVCTPNASSWGAIPVLEEEPKTPVIIVHPKCTKCHKDLCQELDACYTKDPNDITRCAKCRRH